MELTLHETLKKFIFSKDTEKYWAVDTLLKAEKEATTVSRLNIITLIHMAFFCPLLYQINLLLNIPYSLNKSNPLWAFGKYWKLHGLFLAKAQQAEEIAPLVAFCHFSALAEGTAATEFLE